MSSWDVDKKVKDTASCIIYLKTALIHKHLTANMETPEGLRYDLSQSMSGMRREISQEIQEIREKFDVGNKPLF